MKYTVEIVSDLSKREYYSVIFVFHNTFLEEGKLHFKDTGHVEMSFLKMLVSTVGEKNDKRYAWEAITLPYAAIPLLISTGHDSFPLWLSDFADKRFISWKQGVPPFSFMIKMFRFWSIAFTALVEHSKCFDEILLDKILEEKTTPPDSFSQLELFCKEEFKISFLGSSFSKLE